jgi:hypothetical protein
MHVLCGFIAAERTHFKLRECWALVAAARGILAAAWRR